MKFISCGEDRPLINLENIVSILPTNYEGQSYLVEFNHYSKSIGWVFEDEDERDRVYSRIVNMQNSNVTNVSD